MSQVFVENNLKSPSTAQFPYYDPDHGGPPTIVKIDDYAYEVYCYVDSENSFGAMIRTQYFCRLRKIADDKWSCDEVRLLPDD